MANLKILGLRDNKIGDAGMTSLAGAIASGSMANLKELYFDNNQIGDEGMKAFASAIASGSLPALKTVVVDTEHKRQLVAACKARNIRIA